MDLLKILSYFVVFMSAVEARKTIITTFHGQVYTLTRPTTLHWETHGDKTFTKTSYVVHTYREIYTHQGQTLTRTVSLDTPSTMATIATPTSSSGIPSSSSIPSSSISSESSSSPSSTPTTTPASSTQSIQSSSSTQVSPKVEATSAVQKPNVCGCPAKNAKREAPKPTPNLMNQYNRTVESSSFSYPSFSVQSPVKNEPDSVVFELVGDELVVVN